MQGINAYQRIHKCREFSYSDPYQPEKEDIQILGLIYNKVSGPSKDTGQ